MGRIVINYVLKNGPCIDAGRCLPCCGMCENPNNRVITTRSLFGDCRKQGRCRDDCGSCRTIALERLGRIQRAVARMLHPKESADFRYTHMIHCYSATTQELICYAGNRLCDPIPIRHRRPAAYA